MPKLLVVKLGAIGDVIMAIPGAHLMHQAGYSVDWVVSEAVAPILQLYPWINVLPVDEAALLRSGKASTGGTLLSLWKRLIGRGHYDVCATLYYDKRYGLLSLPVRAARKVTLSHDDRTRMLVTGRHHTDEYARILTGRRDQEMPTQLAPERAEALPPARVAAKGRPRVVLVPAGARNLLRDDALRRWPVEYYVELARILVETDHEVVLCGGRDDGWASEFFAGLPVQDLIGQLSLVETLAILDSAAVTVTHDTGPLHMAGITSTAIVALFGPTDPRGRLPRRPNCTALWGGEGFACRPCYDGRDYAPCPHNGCLHQVTVALALDAVKRLLCAVREGRAEPPCVEVPQPTAGKAMVSLTELLGAQP